MADSAEVVRTFFQSMQDRDWARVRTLVSPDVRVRYSSTGEQFDGPAFVDIQIAYPDGRTIDVDEVLASGDSVATSDSDDPLHSAAT